MNKASENTAPSLLGALLGWKRFRVDHGFVVRLQAGYSATAAKQGQFREYDLALTITQLRQLAHDLNNAADEAEGRLPEKARSSWFSRFR